MICQLSADDTTGADRKDELDTAVQIIKKDEINYAAEKNDDDKELVLEQKKVKRYLGSYIGKRYIRKKR